MSETYPPDSELMNIQSDSQTGVEYIPTGTAPYYMEFRRLLYRLLLALGRANDLRVYDEGGLDIGVKAGKFWLQTQLVEYAGSSGNALADDRASIYIYLDGFGNLVTNEYDCFPDMATTPHVRLATVTTSGGRVCSLVDCRSGHNTSIPWGAGGIRGVVKAHTVNTAITAAESGSIHTNFGATGVVTLTLPSSAPVGTTLTFAVQSAQELRVDPGTATIRDDSGQAAGKYKSACVVGAALSLVSDSGGDWATLAKHGSWVEES